MLPTTDRVCTHRESALGACLRAVSSHPTNVYVYVKTLLKHSLKLQPAVIVLHFTFSNFCSGLSYLILFQSGLITGLDLPCTGLLAWIWIQVVVLSGDLRVSLQTLYHLDPSLNSGWVPILSHHSLAFCAHIDLILGFRLNPTKSWWLLPCQL